MSTEVNKSSYVALTSEEIERHVHHAQQLRSEAIADGFRQLIAGIRRQAGNLKTPGRGVLSRTVEKWHAHGACH